MAGSVAARIVFEGVPKSWISERVQTSRPPAQAAERSGRPQALEEGDEGCPVDIAQAAKALRGRGCLATVHVDGLLQSRGPAVVHVRPRVRHAPQWRRPPFVRQRL